MAKAERETHPKLVFRDQSVGFIAKPHAYHAQRKRRWPVSKRSREEVELDWVHVAQSHSFKTVFLGDSDVGKTCLAKLFVERKVQENSTNTIGFDHHIKELKLEDGIPVKLQLWDTAGMEQFRNALITKYYRNADGIVLVYDITRAESFEHVENWIAEVKIYCGLENVKMVLIGNKLDQQSERKVPTEEGQRFADRYGMTFIELSAMELKTLLRLEELFTTLAQQMLTRREEKELTYSSSCAIQLGKEALDDWVLVQTPDGPTPRYAHCHQDAKLSRSMQFSQAQCKCAIL